jgi:N,N'-diacetyllegionaminate synthase
MKTFVIAEAGVNHNGRLDLALALVERAAEAGADAVKFQTFTADTLVAKGTATVAYQNRSGHADQHEMIRSLELSHEAHGALAHRARELGIEFMSTAFDAASADYLVRLGVRRVKVPSGEVTNLPFLRHLAGYGLPVILSTGMADLDEVGTAVETIREAQRGLAPSPDNLTVLHCTSAYPTPDEDVNLSAMVTIARAFSVPVGYSDHTFGTFVSPVAVALGARVIEKHVTLDRSLPGPDHSASLEPGELKAMIADIRRVELLVGDGVKAARPSELEARQLVRRGLKAARPLPAGHVIRESDIAILRPAEGIAPGEYEKVVGRRLATAVSEGSALTWEALD